MLTTAVGLIVAPAVVFFRDLERATKLLLRFLFYASPIVYGITNLPDSIRTIASFNPLAGVMSLYRAAFFPAQLDWFAVGASALVSLVLLGIGIALFQRSERSVLKEL